MLTSSRYEIFSTFDISIIHFYWKIKYNSNFLVVKNISLGWDYTEVKTKKVYFYDK